MKNKVIADREDFLNLRALRDDWTLFTLFTVMIIEDIDQDSTSYL